MKKIMLFLLVVLLTPFNVNAVHEVIDARCTNALKLTLREEAQNVVYRLSQTENNNVISYTGYFYNMTENLVLMATNNNVYEQDRIENLKPGSTVIVTLYASNKTYCEGYKALSKIINIPYYNPYFGSDLCVGNEKFSLCAENANVSLNEEEFKKKLEDYKTNLKKEEELEIDDEIVEEYHLSLYDLFMKYRYYILLGLIISLIILEIITIKEKKKRGIL